MANKRRWVWDGCVIGLISLVALGSWAVWLVWSWDFSPWQHLVIVALAAGWFLGRKLLPRD